jgi:hypothetical protein
LVILLELVKPSIFLIKVIHLIGQQSYLKLLKYNLQIPQHMYLLEDMQGNPTSGAFYGEELQVTKYPDILVYLVEKILKQRGNKVFVKWLGFDNNHNSWIKKTSVL